MAFSIENTAAYADSVSFDDFVREETSQRECFISTSQREFHTAVERFFEFDAHALSEQQLIERRSQMFIIFFLKDLFFILNIELWCTPG